MGPTTFGPLPGRRESGDWDALMGRHGSGMVKPGNIDIMNRPVAHNPDGTISTVRSMSVNFGGPEVLIPTVSDDGRVMGDDEAIETYRRGGRHLGMFKTPADATAFAQALHNQQAGAYMGKR